MLLLVGIIVFVALFLKVNKEINIAESSHLKLCEEISTIREEILTVNVPVSDTGLNHYAQGGIVVDGIAYFTAVNYIRRQGDKYIKSNFFPYIISFAAHPPFKKIRTLAFQDTYDSSPLYMTTKEGTNLIIAHEYIREIVKFHKVVDAFICIVTKTQRTWGNVMSP